MNDTFRTMFGAQKAFQYELLGKETPVDSPTDYAYSALGLVGELGEVLKADKRWKNSRSDHYDREEKLEEICDVFAFAINMALFSGFDFEEVYQGFMEKNEENFRRIYNEKATFEQQKLLKVKPNTTSKA